MTNRERLEAIIEECIELLDLLDGDAYFEPETDQDDNPISLQGIDRVPAKRIRRRAA